MTAETHGAYDETNGVEDAETVVGNVEDEQREDVMAGSVCKKASLVPVRPPKNAAATRNAVRNVSCRVSVVYVLALGRSAANKDARHDRN